MGEQGTTAPPAAPVPWQHPAPWEVPPAWALADERRNPAARWALGLGIASVVPGVALGAVAAGVLALLRTRRTRGRGLVPAVVGLALATLFLLADVGLGLAAAAGVLPGTHAASAPAAGGSGGSGGDADPDALPDPDDRANSELSARQQAYVDALDDITYLNFRDSTLIAMGHLACSDFDAGRTPAQDNDRLGDRYGAGLGDAWDVQRAATRTFCPQYAALLVDGSSAASASPSA